MIWLGLSIVLVAAVASFFGASFLSSAWKRMRKTDPAVLRLAACLPGYDCGLCGRSDCRSYAEALDRSGADPALCSPGGSRLEFRLRSILSEREGDGRGAALRAVVRCGGRDGVAKEDFPYDGLPDCRSAMDLFGGPRRCKDGCLGLGSCAFACPLDAIRVVSGLAIVNPAACTGCGACVGACPAGIISLIPRDQAWYVACSSKRERELRSEDCGSACTACGECARRSGHSEFRLEGGMARENPDSTGGRWADIAEGCPTGAIALVGTEKKRRSPFRKNTR